MEYEDSKIVYIGVAVSSGISFISCFFIIFLYISKPELRTFSFKMVCSLLFCDILHSIAYFIPTYDLNKNDPVCMAQAFLITISSMLCVLWSFVIGLHLYLSISGRASESFMKWYIICTWVLSLGLGFSPLIQDDYAKSFGWCWVRSNSFISEFVLFYIPLWIVIAGNCYFYIYIILKTKKLIENIQGNFESLNKLKLYPLVCLICYVPITINRILEYYYTLDFQLVMVGGIVCCSQGLLNSIIYGLNRSTKNILRAESEYSSNFKITLCQM